MPLPRDLIAFTGDWKLALFVVPAVLTVTVVVVQLEQSMPGEEQYEGHAQA